MGNRPATLILAAIFAIGAWTPTAFALAEDPQRRAAGIALLLWVGLALLAILALSIGTVWLILRLGARVRGKQARRAGIRYHDVTVDPAIPDPDMEPPANGDGKPSDT